MAAIHNALSVPEAVEAILLALPLRQIIFARRVCHEFNRVFCASSRIRKALFLQSTNAKAITWYPHSPNDATPHQKNDAGDWKASAGGRAIIPFANPFIAWYVEHVCFSP